MGKGIRRALFGVALLICIGCWAVTFAGFALYGLPGKDKWIGIMIIACFATEALFWVGAFTLGWSIFDNRRRLWERITGRKGS
jgi:hypothetical protein